MPVYDFRCKNCGTQFSLSYRSIGEYEQATPICPNCGHQELARVINRVAIPRSTTDYTNMNAQEMLSVMESGNQKDVADLFQQVGGTLPDENKTLNQTGNNTPTIMPDNTNDTASNKTSK